MSLLSVDAALELRKGKRLVFTNGVFDVLHVGHVTLLATARELGDLLLVGINTDASARRLGKGKGRPVNPLEDRAAVLSAVRFVDGVIAFEEDTPAKLIEALRPEVHVKGGDYAAGELPEAATVRAYGGEIVIVPLVPGRSTSNTLRRMGIE